MKTLDFDYFLPEELIAVYPAQKRDHSRLLVLSRRKKGIEHLNFFQITDLLRPGDVLVRNDSRVFPARLLGQKKTGGRVEVLLNHEISPGVWEAVGKRIKGNGEIVFGHGLIGEVLESKEGIIRITFNKNGPDFFELIEKIGQIPLPPYIEKKREKNTIKKFDDRQRYQTVYANLNGSSAAPTAGLHFTPLLFDKIIGKGIAVKDLTLHVGLGTFAPVKEEDIESHQIHEEFFSIGSKTLHEIIEAKKSGHRIIAVGTTTTRVLEDIFRKLEQGEILIDKSKFVSGWTSIYIYPPYKFRAIDGLITNFHLPKSSLLMLVSAFTGREKILTAYKEAIRKEYRFYSYGDAMLIT